MKLTRPNLIPAIAWLIISTFLLTIPGTELPKEDWFDRMQVDKIVHIVMFALLVITWCWGSALLSKTRTRNKRTFLFITLVFVGYGIAMEFVQFYFIPFRSFDVGDILADAAGAFVGYYFSCRRYIKK